MVSVEDTVVHDEVRRGTDVVVVGDGPVAGRKVDGPGRVRVDTEPLYT